METTQELSDVETSEQLQLRLAQQNPKDSLHAFSIRNEYNYRTVCTVAQRWWHRRDRQPHGGLARDIMSKMQAEFGHD
jgi:hypothetical protein